MGVFMGMLFGALDTPLHAETMTARQQFVHAARTMGSRSMHMAKTFAIMGAIFSGTECLVEKVSSPTFAKCFLQFFFSILAFEGEAIVVKMEIVWTMHNDNFRQRF